MTSKAVFVCELFLALAPARTAGAQPDTQLWGELTFNWIKSHRFTYGLDIEPKVLVSAPAGDPGWATLDLTPSVEFTHGRWIDMVGEMLVGRTKQTDDLDSTEVTPRVGMRLHLLSNLRDELTKEKRPKHRMVLRNLVRLEWRNLYYSTDKPQSSTLRFRDRLEMSWSLTRSRLTDDGATYLIGDAEWFWPLDEPGERFANKQRLRTGLGYRHNFAWRVEVLYILNRTRNTLDDSFTTTDNVVDFKVKRVW